MNRMENGMMRLLWMFLAVLLPCSGFAADAAHTVAPGEVLERAIAAFAKVNDYTCILERKESFGGGIKAQKNIRFKFMKPGSYSMRWDGEMVEKAVYVAGQSDGRMLVRATKIFDFIRFGVDPALALKYGRHTVMEADIGHILQLFAQNYQKAATDPQAQITYDGNEMLDGRPVWRFKALFPANRGYYGHRILVDIDQGWVLPVRMEVYGWQDEFLEMYAYSKLVLNPGLTAKDFDIGTPE
jgi:outer membrane lipoprotein-sorting protein